MIMTNIMFILFVVIALSVLTSRASSRSLSLTKQSLNNQIEIQMEDQTKAELVFLLCCLTEGHASESWREGFCVHLASCALEKVCVKKGPWKLVE